MTTPRNRSVFKAFAMLKSFKSSEEWVTSSELSRRANLPEASGYRLIQTLQEIGAVVRGPHGRYKPGMLLVSLSQNVAISDLLHEASRSITTELSNRLNVTVHVGILEDGMVHYVTRASTLTSFSPHTRMGCQLEAYCSGLGKILLAALPEDQLERFVIDGDLVALTPHTITDRSVLKSTLVHVRHQGFALDERETREDMCCVAVPVFDRHGRTVAAMSATENAEQMTPERRAQMLEGLLVAASDLTRTVFPTAPDVSRTAKRHAPRRDRVLEASTV
jgi:IclR family acetate operon transcriptional repressor